MCYVRETYKKRYIMTRQFINYACQTDTGITRTLNEDTYIDCPELGLWVIADGMGGYEGGEIASEIAVNQIHTQIAQGESLTDALYSAHEAVLYAADNGIGKKGMGTTAVALLIKGNQYQIAWVGDSRAYLWDRRQFVQLTHDHSVVQELIDFGAISKEEAFNHPDRNIITQALGSPITSELKVDSVSGQLRNGQSVLLCSDGLTTEVREDEINRMLSVKQPEKTKINQLIAAALDGGGKDNVTAVIVSFVVESFWSRMPLIRAFLK